MFVQVIQAQTSDTGALRAQMEAWEDNVKSGAVGYLGSTAGVAEDGTFIAAVRFESADAATANQDRAEQSAWWEETSKLFNGEPTFYNCEDVDEFHGGGSDDAGFVQVIQGYAKDKEKMKEMGKQMEEDQSMQERRPDVIGGFVAWGPNDGFSQFIYFTSEEEARKGEQAGAESDEDGGQQWSDMVTDVKFLDLKDPWLTSP